MSTRIRPSKSILLSELSQGPIDRAARRLVIRMLSQVRYGRIVLQDGPDRHEFGHCSQGFPVSATLTVVKPGFYSALLLGGSLGAAEAYMAGHWTVDDLVAAIRIVIRNRAIFESLDKGWSRLSTPLNLMAHWLRKNTRLGSRSNIVAHYDLGNDFYRLFLDETLTYSCGIFESAHASLKEASIAKYDRLCRKLQLNPNDHILEIGTGWGGFALHAAGHYGCRVTTTTLSDEQYRLAAERFGKAGLQGRVTLLRKDYRDLEGTYDKLVSIEMIEAVGHQFLEEFFSVCSQRLKPDGSMALQAITIADQVYDRHKLSVDFIKRYIFPGSCIPSVTAICTAVARATDLRLFHLEDITAHYALTLAQWRRNFFAKLDQVRALGYDDAFIRMWEYYLCYCQAGFSEHYIGDVQMVLTKPLCRRQPILADRVRLQDRAG
jgi:cyclopropane-fatty-acyl-phospholipid synthase